MVADELQGKSGAAIRKKNGRRDKTGEAASFLRRSGAFYLRGVFHRRPGWWLTDDIFLGARSIEALAEFERLNLSLGSAPGTVASETDNVSRR